MATNKQICKASDDFNEWSEILQMLKNRKQMLQEQLAEINQRIDAQQVSVANALETLKTLVNE